MAHGRAPGRPKEIPMTTVCLPAPSTSALLMATALTPMTGLAADMTMERALNPQREPQNWILHHGNYQGHRFSALKEINTDTRQEPEARLYGGARRLPERRALRVRRPRSDAHRRGRHDVRAGRLGLGLRDRPHQRPEGAPSSGRWTPAPTATGPATSPAAASTTAASRCGRTRSSRSRSTGACSRSTRRPARSCGSARSPSRRSARR